MKIEKRYLVYISVILVIIVALHLSAPWINRIFPSNKTLVAKVKILERNDHELYGGLGNQSGPIGCSSDLFVEPNSSLSFRCGTTDGFGDWIHVFSSSNTTYVCPDNVFSNDRCLECQECSTKIDRLKALDVLAPKK